MKQPAHNTKLPNAKSSSNDAPDLTPTLMARLEVVICTLYNVKHLSEGIQEGLFGSNKAEELREPLEKEPPKYIDNLINVIEVKSLDIEATLKSIISKL